MRKFDEYTDTELFYMLKSDKTTSGKAFAELYARLSPRVFAYCLRFLGSKEEAEDIFQESFARLYQSAQENREMTNVPAFLLRIARNLCVNSRRMERKDLAFEEYMSVDAGIDANSEKEELLDLIGKAIEHLPKEFREVFILREYDGLSYTEIAKVTGETLNTVRIRLYRAKHKIREILSPYLTELNKFN